MSMTNIELTKQQDTCTWQVRYEDDTVVPEYDDNRPDGRGWAEIEPARVRSVSLLGSGKAWTVCIPDGASPVFFRRRRIEINPNGDASNRSTTHCIGWMRGERGVYLFMGDDGSCLLTTDLQAV